MYAGLLTWDLLKKNVQYSRGFFNNGAYPTWFLLIRFQRSRQVQWFPGTDHLIVDSSDQQTPSINLQTARETPVIHPPRPAFACLWVAPRADNYVRGVAIRALIGSASTHWIIAFMRFDCQATSSRLPDLPVAKMPITVTASFDFDCKLTAFLYLSERLL